MLNLETYLPDKVFKERFDGKTFLTILRQNHIRYQLDDSNVLLFDSTNDMNTAKSIWFNLTGKRGFST